MKIAFVHDYIKDAGGAERVLLALTEIYPDAPIYTAFKVDGSDADKIFAGKIVHESFLAPLLKMWRLYSPLRFLLPVIWGSFDLSKYDLVITSSSNYIARGFKVGKNTKVICYCHTPPRFLYGFKTGFDWKKNIFVRIYGEIIGVYLKVFDYNSAQKINYWIANSKNVQERIQKFYHKISTVIYPPVEVDKIISISSKFKKENYPEGTSSAYFLIVSRLVGSKGLIETVELANKLNFKLKIIGNANGFTSVENKLKELGKDNVEFIGRVPDVELWQYYAKAKGFIALAKDEDFGLTVVEAQAAGTPIVAFNGGGFKESVIPGKTGILVDSLDEKTLQEAFEKFNKIKWNKKVIMDNAKRFGKDRFEKEIKDYVQSIV